jgi:hypothetical protein
MSNQRRIVYKGMLAEIVIGSEVSGILQGPIAPITLTSHTEKRLLLCDQR